MVGIRITNEQGFPCFPYFANYINKQRFLSRIPTHNLCTREHNLPPDSEKEVGPDQVVPLRLPLAQFPGFLVGPARQEMLENVAARQHGVAAHVVHPPDQTLPPLGDEVLLEAPGGLLLRQAGHGDDGETLHEPSVEPVEVLVPGGMEEEGTSEGRRMERVGNVVDRKEVKERDKHMLV